MHIITCFSRGAQSYISVFRTSYFITWARRLDAAYPLERYHNAVQSFQYDSNTQSSAKTRMLC